MQKVALSRVILAVVVVIIIIVAAVGVVLVTTKSTTTTTTSSSTTAPPVTSTSAPPVTTSISSATSVITSTSSTSLVSSASNNTIVLDDAFWPVDDFNELWAWGGIPYPSWGLDAMYQPLVNINETAEYNSGVIQYLPGLADSWTVSPNATTYTFNLRSGINFSNGDPFNAYEVWTQMYLLYYLSGNSSSWLVSYAVFNMSPVVFGPATIAILNQSSLANPSQSALNIMENTSWPIYVTGPNQIVFQLAAPFQYFLGLLLVTAGIIFDSQYVFDHGGPGNSTSINVYFNTNPIPGTGPYEISHIAEDSYVVYTQNPTYWGNSLTPAQIQADPFLDPGHAKNVVIYYKSDDVARYTDISTGKAQIAIIESEDWNSIISNPTMYSYYHVPKYSALEALFSLDTNLYPTNITDVRLAIVHAINYTDLINKAFLGQGQELVPPEYPIYGQYYNLGNLTPYQYNTTLAKQYLASANLTGTPTITYYSSSTTIWQGIAGQVIQSDLAQIGITVNLVTQPYAQCEAQQGAYAFNLGLNSSNSYNIELPGCGPWGPSELTPADAWVDFASNRSGIGNTAVYSNPIVENGINAFFDSQNTTYIQSQMKAAQLQLYNDAPLITIGLGLWIVDGSLAWQNGVIKSFLVDPLTTGTDTMPILNTITLG